MNPARPLTTRAGMKAREDPPSRFCDGPGSVGKVWLKHPPTK